MLGRPTHLGPWGLLALALLLPGCGGSGGGGGGGGPPGPDVTPPTVVVDVPTGPRALIPGDVLRVTFRADDDRDATVEVVLDADGSLATTSDQTILFTGTDQNGNPVTLDLATQTVFFGAYTLFVVVDDGTNPPVAGGGTFVLAYPGQAGVSPNRRNSYGVTGVAVVFTIGETEEGGVILNGDGDVGDGVIARLDATNGAVQVSGLTVDVRTPLGQPPNAIVLPDDTDAVAWPRRELDEGMDLNGDLDVLDTVVAFDGPKLAVTPNWNPTGGAALTSYGASDARLVLYQEPAHGADLNGDLDALDRTLAILRYTTNALSTVFPLGVRPGSPVVGNQAFVVFLADEATQGPGNGGQDLNLDLDTIDTLGVLADAAGGMFWGTWNVDPAAARSASAAAPSFALYYVDEFLASPLTPLNGDGDSTDFVPTLLTGPATETVPGLGLNGGPGAAYAFCDGNLAVYVAGEEGTVDRNGDGDALDTQVLYFSDAVVSPTVATALGPAPGGLTGLALDGGAAAHVAPGWLALVVGETANGRDFTGDFDQSDSVLMLVDLTVTPPVVHNTQLAPLAPASLPLPGATIPATGVGGSTGLVVQASETANGDLNADGDTTDILLFYFDFAAPTARVALPNTGGLHATLEGGTIAVTAGEALSLTDFDGNGSTNDFVLRVFDLTGAVLEPGLLCSQFSVPAADDGTLWAYLRSEVAEARDLNADGDGTDLVQGIWLR